MTEETLEALDFPKIRGMLVNFCATEPGKEKASKFEPFSDRNAVTTNLNYLEEIVKFDGEPALSEIVDIRGSVDRAKAGAVLSAEELLRIRI
ncbi:MAG: hypothetical protein ACUVUD_07270, partial [bacterium]